jgi:DnaK suppressor protein
MDALHPDQIAQLRELLSQRLHDLQAQPGARPLSEFKRLPVVEEIETSPADSASNRTMNQLAAEADELRLVQLRALRNALARIDSGDYGYCEQCGNPIGFSRLSARPEARFCITCQTRLEQGRR